MVVLVAKRDLKAFRELFDGIRFQRGIFCGVMPSQPLDIFRFCWFLGDTQDSVWSKVRRVSSLLQLPHYVQLQTTFIV